MGDLSTGTVTKQDCDKLDKGMHPVLFKNEYGYVLHVDRDKPVSQLRILRSKDFGYSRRFIAMMEAAQKANITYLLLDADGPVVMPRDRSWDDAEEEEQRQADAAVIEKPKGTPVIGLLPDVGDYTERDSCISADEVKNKFNPHLQKMWDAAVVCLHNHSDTNLAAFQSLARPAELMALMRRAVGAKPSKLSVGNPVEGIPIAKIQESFMQVPDKEYDPTNARDISDFLMDSLKADLAKRGRVLIKESDVQGFCDMLGRDMAKHAVTVWELRKMALTVHVLTEALVYHVEYTKMASSMQALLAQRVLAVNDPTALKELLELIQTNDKGLWEAVKQAMQAWKEQAATVAALA